MDRTSDVEIQYIFSKVILADGEDRFDELNSDLDRAESLVPQLEVSNEEKIEYQIEIKVKRLHIC